LRSFVLGFYDISFEGGCLLITLTKKHLKAFK
jgi:hypothetical protein